MTDQSEKEVWPVANGLRTGQNNNKKIFLCVFADVFQMFPPGYFSDGPFEADIKDDDYDDDDDEDMVDWSPSNMWTGRSVRLQMAPPAVLFWIKD